MTNRGVLGFPQGQRSGSGGLNLTRSEESLNRGSITISTSGSTVLFVPSKRRIYIAQLGANAIQVVDTSSNTVAATISYSPGGIMRYVAANDRIVTLEANGTAWVFNPNTNSVTFNSATGWSTGAYMPVFSVNDAGTQMFIPRTGNANQHTLWNMAGTNNMTSAAGSGGGQFQGSWYACEYIPSVDRTIHGGGGSSSLCMWNHSTNSDQVSGTTFSGPPYQIIDAPDRARVIVLFSDRISLVDPNPASFVETASVSISSWVATNGTPLCMAYSPKSSRVLVMATSASAIVDLNSLSVVATLPITTTYSPSLARSTAAVYVPELDRMYAMTGSSLVIVDMGTAKILGSVPTSSSGLPRTPSVYEAVSNRMYVQYHNTSSISFITPPKEVRYVY